MRSMAWGLVAGSTGVSQTTDCGQSSSTRRGGGALSGRGLATIRAVRSMEEHAGARPAPLTPLQLGGAPVPPYDRFHTQRTHKQEKGKETGRKQTQSSLLLTATAQLEDGFGGGAARASGGWRCWWRLGCLLLALAAARLLLLLPGCPPRWRHPHAMPLLSSRHPLLSTAPVGKTNNKKKCLLTQYNVTQSTLWLNMALSLLLWRCV